MVKSFLQVILIPFTLVSFSCSVKSKSNKEPAEANFYTQGNKNRVAAEWEPALGTMIVWPLSLPHKLVIELAKDNHLFTLVENDASKKEALKWYKKWGIDSAKNTFIYAPQGVDSWWVRDWGPSALFTPDRKMKLADGKYIYSTPLTTLQCNDTLEFLYKTHDNKIIKTETDDSATGFIGKALHLDVLDLPFINTGGNVATDGLGTAFSTCILINENRFYGVSHDEFLKLNKELLGFTSYNVISNFEKLGIQHIDCYLKLLDEERILVIQPPEDHELYPIYESIIQNELSKLRSPYGRPYEILRIKTGRYNQELLAAYTNSLIVNKTIYVPLFQIKEDSMALKRWREVMPGYVVKGFDFDLADEPLVSPQMKDHYKIYGWKYGDALHCRARAIWDPEMLFITTKRIEPEVDSKNSNKVYATIIDYSNKGLIRETTELMWRFVGKTDWKHIRLNQIEATNNFLAEIPSSKPGTTIEYYVSAVSNSGRTETQPKTAPLGTYKFSIK